MSDLRLLAAVDAGAERSGVATYWRDLCDAALAHGASAVMWQVNAASCGLSFREGLRVTLPLVGDRTQRVQLVSLSWARAAFASARPTVVAVATPGPIGIAALVVARRMRIPVVAAIHTDFEAIGRALLPRSIAPAALRILGRLERWVVRHSQAVVVPSQRLADVAATRYGRQPSIARTPLGAVMAAHPPAPPARIRSLLFAGRFSPEKRPEAILAAARRFPELHFGLIGDGPLATTLARQAPANVLFQPWMSRGALKDEIDRADLIVLPSHNEAFGTIALEAMARNRPVLVSTSCGIAERICHGANGWVYDSDVGLDNAIAEVTRADRSTIAAVACAGRSTAMQYAAGSLTDWMDIFAAAGTNHC